MVLGEMVMFFLFLACGGSLQPLTLDVTVGYELAK